MVSWPARSSVRAARVRQVCSSESATRSRSSRAEPSELSAARLSSRSPPCLWRCLRARASSRAWVSASTAPRSSRIRPRSRDLSVTQAANAATSVSRSMKLILQGEEAEQQIVVRAGPGPGGPRRGRRAEDRVDHGGVLREPALGTPPESAARRSGGDRPDPAPAARAITPRAPARAPHRGNPRSAAAGPPSRRPRSGRTSPPPVRPARASGPLPRSGSRRS